jgi:hypothetical protein
VAILRRLLAVKLENVQRQKEAISMILKRGSLTKTPLPW